MTMLKNQKGQMIVETALIVIILMAMNLLVKDFMKAEGVFDGRTTPILKDLITSPFQRVKVMMESGTWTDNRETAQKVYHPMIRMSTSAGDVP